MKLSRCLKIMMVLLVLTACGTNSRPPSTDQRTLPDYVSHVGTITDETNSKEVADLWQLSSTHKARGEYDKAGVYIEGAIMRDSENALLWSEAAEIYLKQSLYDQAESYANKSNDRADESTSRAILYRNWLIIEHSRDMRGDLLGKRDAHTQVLKYQ